MYIKSSQYQAINSPSKIEGGWGEYDFFFEIQPNKYHLSHCHTPPLSPSILEGELTHSCLTILIVTIET